LGVAALYASLSITRGGFWPALILLAAAIYLLKGCPLCWTLGLIETIVMAIHRRNERKFDSANSDLDRGFSSNRKNYQPATMQTTIPAREY